MNKMGQKKNNCANLEFHKFNYNKPINTPWLSGCFMFCRVIFFSNVGFFDSQDFKDPCIWKILDLSKFILETISFKLFYPSSN